MLCSFCGGQENIDVLLAKEIEFDFDDQRNHPPIQQQHSDQGLHSEHSVDPRPAVDGGADETEGISPEIWWPSELQRQILTNDDSASIRIGLNELILSALAHSRKIEIAKIDRFVEQEQITQTDANFDWNFFANNLFTNTDQQTGSELDGGAGLARLIQQQFDKDIGLKRENYYGGNFEVSQDLNFLDSNSDFVDPNEQGFTQLTLRYNQPLLRDGGLVVNYGQVILARLNAQAAAADSDTAIVDIIFQVVEAYWNIYKLRSQFLVQKRLVSKIQGLLDDILKRTKIDARKSLIGQAESELATQQSILAATEIQLIQAQFVLVRLVGDRELGNFKELIPTTKTPSFELPIESNNALAIALQYRPELRAAAKRIKGSELTTDINIRNLLPGLAFILETNVNGVNGDFDIGKSLGDQFSKGGPTYSVGLNYEIPIGNRGARSRLREAQLLVAREVSNFEDTVDQIRLDVDTAITGLTGSKDQYQIRLDSFNKAELVVESLIKRRNIFPGQLDQVSQLYVREILDAQQRSAAAANAIIDLLFDYSLATIQLRQAMGNLLNNYDDFSYDDYVCDPDPRHYRRFGKLNQKQASKRAVIDSQYADRPADDCNENVLSPAPIQPLPNWPAVTTEPAPEQPKSKFDYPMPNNPIKRQPINQKTPIRIPATSDGRSARRYPLPAEHFQEDEIVRISNGR